jgi:hypothetical protein
MERRSNGRWVPVDPIAAQLFTTNPGRVPFLASYHAESNAGTEVIRRGSGITHWVEFTNRGGRMWRNDVSIGRLMLATWNPPERASAFAARSWPYDWVPTALDQTAVPPNGIGRFTFRLRANPPPGDYVEPFNLLANNRRWFDWSRLGSFYVPITVLPR